MGDRSFWRGVVVAAAIAITLEGVLASSPASAQAPVRDLRVGQVLTERITNGAIEQYAVAVKTGQALHVVVDQKGIDVIVRVFAPDGTAVVEVDGTNGANGPEDVVAVARSHGDHRIEVRPFTAGESGAYDLRVVAVRKATRTDQRRAEALIVQNEADALLGKGGAENRAEAVRKFTSVFVTGRALKDTALTRKAANRLYPVDVKTLMTAMGLESLPGDKPVYYSRGARTRAEQLRTRFLETAAFFERRLNVKPTIVLGVLSRQDSEWLSWWRYGVPIAPGDFVPWPVDPDDVDQALTKATIRRGVLPDETVSALRKTGLSLEAGMAQSADDGLAYPVGLVYRRAYGAQTASGSPFLALLVNTVMRQAYRAETPNAPSHAFTDARHAYFLSQQPKYRYLDDEDLAQVLAQGRGTNFDVRSNYAWYDAQIARRAKAVYEARGLAFLDDVKQAFPAGEARLTLTETLDRLEKIQPGFKEWATVFAQ
jgi:hypothetical protein